MDPTRQPSSGGRFGSSGAFPPGKAPELHRFAIGARAIPLQEAARRCGVAWEDWTGAAARRLPLRFPAGYLDLVDPADPADPIRRMAWPDPEEIDEDREAIDDPVGESRRRIGRFIIQKHPNRVILLVTQRCHFYCRFCFRAGAGSEPRRGQLVEAIKRLAGLPELVEVILSGGDPLTLPDAVLGDLVERLNDLPQLKALRIHTRAPVHDPDRITPDLLAALSLGGPIKPWIVLHAAHPRELRPAFTEAVRLIQGAGLPLLNQTVLLKGVNADPETLAALFGGLYRLGVKPYYLHHPDRIAGTARFRVSIPEGQGIYRRLHGLVPGPALPAYVVDLPDGSGKVPVDWLEPVEEGLFRIVRPGGEVSLYRDIAG